MTNTNYYTRRNYTDHTTYGGEITAFDFDGHHTLKSMADRIAADLRFDKMCRQNASNRERNNTYKKGNE